MRLRSFSGCFLLVLGAMPGGVSNAADKAHAPGVLEDIANPPSSWVCLNPQTRRYQALKAASIQEAQRSVGGDSSTPCKVIPAVLDSEHVAQELNTQDPR